MRTKFVPFSDGIAQREVDSPKLETLNYEQLKAKKTYPGVQNSGAIYENVDALDCEKYDVEFIRRCSDNRLMFYI